jgi:hypothetical protein
MVFRVGEEANGLLGATELQMGDPNPAAIPP